MMMKHNAQIDSLMQKKKLKTMKHMSNFPFRIFTFPLNYTFVHTSYVIKNIFSFSVNCSTYIEFLISGSLHLDVSFVSQWPVLSV